MADPPLSLSHDEQAMLAQITARFPGLVQAVETQVAGLIEAAFARLPGLVTTEAGVDYALAEIVDGVAAQGAHDHALLGVTDDNCGAMTLLIARNAAAHARDGLVRRLLDPKRNQPPVDASPLPYAASRCSRTPVWVHHVPLPARRFPRQDGPLHIVDDTRERNVS